MPDSASSLLESSLALLGEPRSGMAFLAASALGALFVWNAYRPLRRPIALATVAFFAGWLTVELALHHIVWTLFAASAFIVMGALDAWPGWVALGLSVVSWAALHRLHRRGHLAEGIASDALRAHLPEAEEPEEDDAERPSRRPVGLRHYSRPFHMKHPSVVRHDGIVYSEVGGKKLRVDVYHRADVPADAPVLLFVHGGAWFIGYKEFQALPMLYRMASQGWVCMSFDYRLSPWATFPDHVVDVKRAIAWAKEHAPRYGGDPSFVALSGNSAGGHLASLAALTPDRASFQPGFEDVDTQVQACVSFYGVYDLANRDGTWPTNGMVRFVERIVMKRRLREHPEHFDLASPIRHVRDDAPPFLVIHGERDTLVPVTEGRAFQAALRDVSRQPVVYIEIPDAQHAFDIFRSVRGHHTLRAVNRFLDAVRRADRRADELTRRERVAAE